jgi:hypothetical protein
MKKYLNLVVLAISIITIISGITQIIKPGFVLKMTGAEESETSSHFFAVIGMFMILFAGLMIQTVYSKGAGSAAIFWNAMQKLGASIAVFAGTIKGLFAIQAMAVAGFDLLTAVLFFYYLQYRKRNEGH